MEENSDGMLVTRPRGWGAPFLALLVALVLALAVPGCGSGDGDGDGSNQPADDPELVEQATRKIERAAAAATDPVRSRYLPGKKRYEVICLSSDMARQKQVPADFIQCHVEAFSTPTKQRPETVYIESEDWRVPVQDGTVGEPVIVDGYRIRDFIRKDNRLGCSVGRTPQERCKSPFAPTGG